MITFDYIETDKRTKMANAAIQTCLKLAPALKDFPFGEGVLSWDRTWGVDITLKGELPSLEAFCCLAGEVEALLGVDLWFYPPTSKDSYARYTTFHNGVSINLWWMPEGESCFWVADGDKVVYTTETQPMKLVCK